MSIADISTGSIRVACYTTAAPSFLPPILTSLRQAYPGVSMTLLESDMTTIMGLLDSGEADIAFTYDQTADNRHRFEPLFQAPPYAVLSANDPLATRSSVTLHDLHDKPMVLLDLPLTRAYFVGLFADLGLKPNIVHSTRSSEMVRTLVGCGYGFSLLNIRPADFRPGVSPYALVPLANPALAPVFGIASQASTHPPAMVRDVISHCLTLRDQGVFAPIVVT
jgi:DNA-binding transcriptional LysR family regulator